jgi:hypothetical protein
VYGAPPGYGAAPAYGRPSPYGAYGPPPGPAGAAVVRHRPGGGLVLGLIGAIALLLSFTALPWVSAGGEDVTFPDIRDAFEAIDDLDSGGSVDVPDVTVPPSVDEGDVSGGGPLGPVVTPPGMPVSPEDTVPGESPLGPVVSPDDLGTPVQAAGGDETEFVEIYAKGLWVVVAVMTVVAVVLSTWLVPRSRGGRVVSGFLMAGIVGMAVNLADEEGTVGPRVSAALVVLLCLGVHGYALIDLYGDTFAPDAAWGVWAGVAGLVVALIGCVMGTRIERVPAHR